MVREQTIKMIAARHDINLTDVIGRFNSGDPDNALLYEIYILKLAEITSAHSYSRRVSR